MTDRLQTYKTTRKVSVKFSGKCLNDFFSLIFHDDDDTHYLTGFLITKKNNKNELGTKK